MKNKLLLFASLFCVLSCFAQLPYNAALPNGYTKKAAVAEEVGRTLVSITYHRPSVNGREGKIWGQLVPVGFVDQGFGNRKAAPWRAGSNENTVIEIDNDIKVEGQVLSRGKYGLFIAYDPQESTVIFSKRSDAWGSFFYEENEDALRVKVKPQPIEKSVENLKFEFTNQTPNSAVIVLSWERLSIPFRVEVDNLKQQFAAFVSESQNPRGWTAQGLNIAASWCLQNNYELQRALQWATMATSPNFPGDPTSFAALSTKAFILDKLGKSDDATAAIKAALPFGNSAQLQQFGRQLLNAKKPKEALAVFQFNYSKSPDQFMTLAGMVRGWSANGDYVKALEFANKALPLAPNEAGKEAMQRMIETLKSGKDIN